MRKNTQREEVRSYEQWKQGNTCSRSPKGPAFGRFFCASKYLLIDKTILSVLWRWE